MNQTTDEARIVLSVNKFVYLLVAVVLGTNTVSLTVQRVANNADKTTYLDKATKRRIDHAITEQDYKHEIIRKDVKIMNLEQDLIECAEDIVEWQIKYNELKEEVN